MPHPSDPDLAKRSHLLGGVAARLGAMGIPASMATLERYSSAYSGPPEGVTGLVCRHPASTAAAQVTVMRARRRRPSGALPGPDGHDWTRDLDLDYRVDADGDLYFEVTVLEDPDGGLRHGRQTSAQRFLTGDEQSVVDAILLWYGHRAILRSTPPPAPAARTVLRRSRADTATRNASAAQPDVRVAVTFTAVPVAQRRALASDVAAVDPRTLCWFFPRRRGGRYAQRVAVALAGYGADLARRESWLVVRAVDDTLILDTEQLIGANQTYRWDAVRWQWHRDYRDAPSAERWQVDDPDEIRSCVELLDGHAVAEALAGASVAVDDDIAALLDGYPTRYLRARYTDVWVRTLYRELVTSAPWRFGWAYQVWRRERTQLGRPSNRPVVLCGLTGLNQLKRPTLALVERDGRPRLEMLWTASNARLPRALWQRPADLEAALRGLTPDYR